MCACDIQIDEWTLVAGGTSLARSLTASRAVRIDGESSHWQRQKLGLIIAILYIIVIIIIS